VRAVLKRIGLCALLVAIVWPATAGEVLTARVRPSSGLAPSDVVVKVLVEPNALNRSLSFAVDSEAFSTSSVTELDGDRAPRSTEVRFRMLPAGSYTVRVTLLGADGERGHFVCEVKLW